MPLTPRDRRFLQTVDRLKLYLLIMAVATFLYVLFLPSSEIQRTTSIFGITLCGMFWVTQRLLSIISLLDFELTRTLNVLKQSLSAEQQGEVFRSRPPKT